jgi:hypothetical protein
MAKQKLKLNKRRFTLPNNGWPLSKPDSVVAAALDDYQKSDLTTEAIAKKHGVWPATLTVWAAKAKIPLRGRGRRKYSAPTPFHLKVLSLAGVLRYEQIGRKFGIEKQQVHRIVKRWKDYVNPRRAPFKPGDVIEWDGKKLTVLDANEVTGTLRDKQGRIYKLFPWAGGKLPKKVGVDPKFAEALAA